MTGLTDPDRRLLALIAAHDVQLRTGLCTLARLGVQVRRSDPARAEALVLQLEAHPYYKAGQTLFDLLEVEDFMLDGDPVAPDWPATATVLAPLAKHFGIEVVPLPAFDRLPELEMGFYLYRDVVIGAATLFSDLLAG